MAEIIRSKGTTDSERYLARLADRTFLNLWSYPNVYRDTFVNGKPAGKELCDLLVVCGDHVIIFSDKNIPWASHKNIEVAWGRWYKRAVKESVRQLRHAKQLITQYPSRIFLDPRCIKALPIKLPPPESMKVHLVAIALGAHQACSDFFNGDSGSFIIRPSLIGDAHHNPSAPHYFPFTIGDIDPDGSFIHVMNDVTLDVIFKELNTITDFTDYLDAKVAFLRSGRLFNTTGEEELLAYYLTHLDGESHGFPNPKKDKHWEQNERLVLDQGFYASMLKNPQYLRRKRADKNSYIWDRLIKAFTDHIIKGTSIIPEGQVFDVANLEIGVRHMAHEPRLARRMYGDQIIEVLGVAHLTDRRFRAMIPSPAKPGNGTAFAFMTLAVPKRKLEGGYQQYRQVRTNILQTYCMAILYKQHHIRRIVGVAMEPPPQPGDSPGSSEDMIMIEQQVWTQEMEDDLEHDCKVYDIMREDRFTTGNMGVTEYPEKENSVISRTPHPGGMNRDQRRAMEARARRRK